MSDERLDWEDEQEALRAHEALLLAHGHGNAYQPTQHDLRTWAYEDSPEGRRAAAQAAQQAQREREIAAEGENPRTGRWRPFWEEYKPKDPAVARVAQRRSRFTSESARAAGRVRSPFKKAAARANGKRGGRPRKPNA